MGSVLTKLCRCGEFHILAISLGFRGICFNRCRKFFVPANPLSFNGICFDKAFPTGNNFIFLFLKDSLFFCRLIYLMGSFSGYPPLEELVVLKGPYFVFVSAAQALSPRILLASWMSFGMIVTCLACMAQRLVSSNSPTKYASAASCRAIIAATLEPDFAAQR